MSSPLKLPVLPRNVLGVSSCRRATNVDWVVWRSWPAPRSVQPVNARADSRTSSSVVPDAGGEEFHQLAGVVFVGLALAVGLGIEIDHHRRVLGDRFEQVVE